MLNFSALMYNVTADTFIDTTPVNYTFGYYSGDDLVVGRDEGTEVSNIPRTDISYNEGNNIGAQFERYAKEYYAENVAFPVLRLYKTEDRNSYIEWNPSAPTDLLISTDDGTFTWSHVLKWVDSTTTLYKPCVFLSTESLNDLTSENVVWSGSTLPSQETSTLFVSYTGAIIQTDNNAFVQVSAGTVLANVTYNGRKFIARGLALACFIFTSLWDGPATIAPASSDDSHAVESPYDPSYMYDNVILQADRVLQSNGRYYRINTNHWDILPSTGWGETSLPIHDFTNIYTDSDQALQVLLDGSVISYGYMQSYLYTYLTEESEPGPGPEPEPPVVPDSDVDPEDIPPEDEPPTPVEPDNPDPYYDPTSDPTSPDYDPTKDPTSPDYDPTVPSTPWRPSSAESVITDAPIQPIQDTIPMPDVPPSFATSNRLLTFYNPVMSELSDLANFLWSSAWSIDTFKKIFANPMDAILGLMVMPTVPASVSTRELSIGNISTGITMRYFTQQFVDVTCGSFDIKEYYMSYLDYAPYTKVVLMLPFIGECKLNTDEVMNKTLSITYRFDIATGACVAFVSVDGSVMYTYNGSACSVVPLSANGWGSVISGLLSMPIKAVTFGSVTGTGPIGTLGAAAAISVTSMKQDISHTGNLTGSPGLMGIQKPYLIITRPRQAIPDRQNTFTGYPSFITESLGSLNGYTEVEQCHLDHIPATADELAEIERLLKEGVLF